MNTDQKKALKDRLGQMTDRQRKDHLRQASELRQVAQRNSKKPVPAVEDFLYKLVCNEPLGEVGTVVRVEATLCHVLKNMEVKPMRMSQETRPVVGDEVEIDLVKNRISRILPRRTQLARPDDRNPENARPVAANIDLVAVVVSVGTPPLHPRLIDRYLFAINKGGANPLIVVNKLDLISEMDVVKQLDQLEPYRAMGIPSVQVSAALGRGLDTLRSHIAGKRVVFVGHSGVGKSSLLNALRPDLEIKEGEVSAGYGRGTHTTTA
ncbi:MAG: ribosome small subunit-dependent GTPase A, partial [Chlorobia bacterium]|nr:ribosome small subunit-dependent GTPase A [Fimbriimonadaceae bacterium]